MKVYVLSHVWHLDCGDFGHEVFTYGIIRQAQIKFKKLMKEAKVDLKHLDTEEDNFVEGDMAWSIWEKGNYAYNHIDLQITECEVE